MVEPSRASSLVTPPTVVAAVEALSEHPTELVVYDRRGRKATARAYPEVARRARAFGAWFEARGVRPGEVVFLCLPTGYDLVEAFLGAALVRALPCVLALPRAIGGLEVFRNRLGLLAEAFPGGHLLTTDAVGAEAGRAFWTPPAELDTGRLAPLDPIDPEELAYVQLTSGSTTEPKAVAISHANVAANTRGIVLAGEGLGEAEDYVSWLPLYHDMGLVGMCLTALFHGSGLVLLSPEAFVGTPHRWLEAIAARAGRSVVTTAPNFGYQWCVDRIKPEKLVGLDLSPLRYACCGAEMVRPETLAAFRERFRPYGLREDVFAPCYGMAETTLAVTMTRPGPYRVHRGRVSCGVPIEGTRVRIVDPNTGSPLTEGVEGEIVVEGSSLFRGYYRNPAATAAVLREGAFRTGDLGYLDGGELFVTGRLKDLIIIDGVNVAPHELEWIAEERVVAEGGRAAAFGLERGAREVPVLVAEVREVPAAEVLAELEERVACDLAPLHDLVLVRRGSLPKTSSGKVRRRAVRELYLAGRLEVLWSRRAAGGDG